MKVVDKKQNTIRDPPSMNTILNNFNFTAPTGHLSHTYTQKATISRKQNLIIVSVS